ncbi:hypothetical protein [Methanobrevibacter sp.]
MSIASTVLTVNERLELARTLMKEKLTANDKYFLSDDTLLELIERCRCSYYDKCSIDNTSDWTVKGNLAMTFDSANKCYNLKTNANQSFGYAILENYYFKLPIAIEYDFMLLQGSNSYNNQFRVGLCYPYSYNPDYFAVIGNVARYSASTTELRTGDIRTTTSDTLNNTLASNARTNVLNQWYHAILTITDAAATFTVTDYNGNAITLSSAIPDGLDENYDNNQLGISKCYNNNTNVRIKNIKVYEV